MVGGKRRSGWSGSAWKIEWVKSQGTGASTGWTAGSAPPTSGTPPSNLQSTAQWVIVSKVDYTYTSAFSAVWNTTSIALGGCGIVAFAALFTEFTVHPPVWVHLVLWLPATLIISLGMLRPLKGVMLASQFANKASEARSDD